MTDLLHFIEHPLQMGCKVFITAAYTLRIIQLCRYTAGKERQAKTGLPDTSVPKGVTYSMFNVAMPWAMESTRKRFLFYLQFAIFHLGIAASISLTFIIPYGPGLLESIVLVRVLQAFMVAGGVIGIYRLCRRIFDPYIRSISSPDDYFSVAMLTGWLFVGVISAPNDLSQGEGHLLVYFLMTAFFLTYVPFSKIMHYIWYPFTRYYFGKTMGYRGVYPIRRGPRTPEA